MVNLKAINILNYFILLIPFALITGPFLPDLIVSISSLIFLIISIKYKLIKYYNNIYFKFFLAFWVYILFLSFFSLEVLISLKTSVFYIRFGIFCILIYYIIDNNENFIKYFSLSLFIAFGLVLLDAYVQYFFGSNIIGIKSPQANRLSSFFGEELIVGSFLSRLFPMVLAFGILMSKKLSRFIGILSLIYLILTDVIIFLSGERTSFGFLVIVNIAYIFFVYKFRFIRFFGFIVSVVVIIFFINNDELVKNRMIDETIKKFYVEKKNENSSEKKIEKKLTTFTEVHNSHYQTALKMFKINPIFGIGPKMYRYECSDKRYATGEFYCTTHPHNTYIQLLAETGIIGFSFIFVLLINVIIFFIKKLKKLFFKHSIRDDYRTCLMIAFSITLFPLAPSGNFFTNWLNIIYFLPVGFYLHSVLKND